MSGVERWSLSWNAADGELCVREPTAAEVEAAASQLSAWYNEDHNRAMMSNQTVMDAGDVRQHFEKVWKEGGRNFLLYFQGQLMGDADLRHLDTKAGTGEFAILVGERSLQGHGFGTRFALMAHALAFQKLDLGRVYVSIIPANRGSLRLFEKLGYQPDHSPAARSYVDQDDDVTMSFGRDDFLRLHGDEARELTMQRR